MEYDTSKSRGHNEGSLLAMEYMWDGGKEHLAMVEKPGSSMDFENHATHTKPSTSLLQTARHNLLESHSLNIFDQLGSDVWWNFGALFEAIEME